MLDTASDVEIYGSGEYFTGEALRMKLTEQMTKLQAQYIEILSKATVSVSIDRDSTRRTSPAVSKGN